ncbi:MAG: metallophosphoesterase [Pseudomonadota bacterium]
MSKSFAFVTFFLVAIGILASVHWYFWVRLVRDTVLPQPWRPIASYCLLFLGASMPLGLFLQRALPFRLGRLLAAPLLAWLGMMLLLLTLLLFSEVVRLVLAVGARILVVMGHPGCWNHLRSLWFGRILAGTAVLVAMIASAWAVRTALRPPQLWTVEIPLARLPSTLDGFTIVQLSDLHIGSAWNDHLLEEVVPRVNALEPDLVVITGDLVDGPASDLRQVTLPLAKLHARHGVYFVTGNHEHYSGLDEWLVELKRLGVRVLRNERTTIDTGIDTGAAEGSFDLAGVDDPAGQRWSKERSSGLEVAIAGRDESRLLVLLAHQPGEFTKAAKMGVDLQLSGHTHGGQIWPWNKVVRLSGQPCSAGLLRKNDSVLYVSSGTGFWGPPMRLFTSAEITRLILRRGSQVGTAVAK